MNISQNTFTFSVAGITLQVSPLFSSTKTYCNRFFSECKPDLYIAMSAEDISLSRMYIEKDLADGLILETNFSDYYLETISLLRKLADSFPLKDRMLIHGSAVAIDGKGYLITAPSGTGKSTHASLLRKLLGDRITMVNDDKPFLDLSGDQIMICGSPWMGKHRIGNNISVPLHGIFFIHQSKDNHIEKLTAFDALPLLLPQCHRPKETNAMLATFNMMDRLLSSVSLYSMGCNMDISAAELSSSYMV